MWVVRTDDEQDLDWLKNTLLPSEPIHYKAVVPTGALSFAKLNACSDLALEVPHMCMQALGGLLIINLSTIAHIT